MLPPMPLSLVPVTAQQDIPKPRPDIAPVTPTQPSARESMLTLDKRHPQDTPELIYEEQQRRRKQRQEHQAESGPEGVAVEEYLETEEREVEEQRQGLWIDTQA
ncbi:hypothetical protein LX59_00910 [Azomonas agilis]|uniref:Aspartate-semialdehyde dehydrogenase n=1 Tax=Azomonas agilis TaxID=116849 RepID=A0A562J1Z8_9GAMM|nr:aspartate-semialdehyde dehydrogenase [Azomonas agilis]TWH76865.1 hypothetical protein LX59_00910 [Azomonas agilis]